MERTKVYVRHERYYYIPHFKYAGVYELYRVNKLDADEIVQNFCLPESAETLAKEDETWRRMGSKLSHINSVSREVNRASKPEEAPLEAELAEEGPKPEVDPEEEKRARRRERRQARKKKEN